MSSYMCAKLVTVVRIHGFRLPDRVKTVFLDGTQRSNVKKSKAIPVTGREGP
jgi:hypothetical protein